MPGGTARRPGADAARARRAAAHRAASLRWPGRPSLRCCRRYASRSAKGIGFRLMTGRFSSAPQLELNLHGSGWPEAWAWRVAAWRLCALHLPSCIHALQYIDIMLYFIECNCLVTAFFGHLWQIWILSTQVTPTTASNFAQHFCEAAGVMMPRFVEACICCRHITCP